MKEIGKVDAIIICVPTPLDIHREPDLSYVSNTVKSIMPYIKRGQVVSLKVQHIQARLKISKKPIEKWVGSQEKIYMLCIHRNEKIQK